jgi:hypothetical protein
LRHIPINLVAVLLTASLWAQQPNGSAALMVQFRQGPPYPIVAGAPNNGALNIVFIGPPGAPFGLATGPLNPGAATFPGGQILDVGTPPGLADVQILVDGTAPGSGLAISPAGMTAFIVPVTGNTTIALPPVQAFVADPTSPFGFRLTAASAVTLMPTKNVLFIQGDFDPGVFGLGPHCRLSDTSLVGFSQLRDFLKIVGFSQVNEVVDTTVAITPALLSTYGVVVLGSNHKTFTNYEVNVLENYVRAGGGLVAYSDSMFGPGSVPSDNQVLTRFGLLTTSDNFGGPVFATSFAPHPISAGLTLGVGGEGVSIFEIVGNATDTFANVTDCVTNGGACLPYPPVAPSGSANPVYSACVAVDAGMGRVVGTFDRNTFFNYPGFGSNLLEVSNLSYAINIFLWTGGY